MLLSAAERRRRARSDAAPIMHTDVDECEGALTPRDSLQGLNDVLCGVKRTGNLHLVALCSRRHAKIGSEPIMISCYRKSCADLCSRSLRASQADLLCNKRGRA